MRIIVLSGSPLAIPALNHLLDHNFLSALICPEDMIATEVVPLQSWAMQKGVPCWQTGVRNLDSELDELIRETKPEMVIVFGFPYTISPSILATVHHGGWNIHFNLQQENRGSITIHQLVRGLGQQVLHQQNISLLPEPDAGSALQQLSLVTVPLLQHALAKVRTISKRENIPGHLIAVTNLN
jgi:methionyl-tRNA formyltransferase